MVTGAPRRIGAYLARTLAATGYGLHLHTGRDEPGLCALAQQLAALYRVQITTHTVDLADPSQVASWVQRLRTEPHPPHVVVNNASEFPPASNAPTPADIARALNIHLLAPMALIHVLDHQVEGHIVNILDARMNLFDCDRAAYELAKRALRDYTLLAAKQLAPRIRVNAIAPGLVLPSPDHDDTHLMHLARLRTPLGMPARLDDLGAALRFLEQAASVTGQIIFVDAGEHLGPPPDRDTTPAPLP